MRAPADLPCPQRLARATYAGAVAVAGPLPHDARPLPAWLTLEPATRAQLVDVMRRALAAAPCACPLCLALRDASP